METRSHKRAEASSSSSQSSPAAASRAAKRPRLSSSSSAATTTASAFATAAPPPLSSNTRAPRVKTRSRRSQSSKLQDPFPMDSPNRREGEGRRRSSGKGRQAERNKEVPDKGKEKEAEGSRASDTERNQALVIDEDDNDTDAGAGMSASSALQGLLRMIEAGLDDLLFPSSALSGSSSSHQTSQLKKILAGLNAEGEEGKQVKALKQLCHLISTSTEDSLASFSVDSFVPVLVGLLNHESNPDIMLLAARAITHLCDELPSSCSSVVHYGAISCFVTRLLTIEYMDLAEQSLQALKKISREHPTACLRAGALMAVLSYLDFFSTGVQRVALSTAANMCKKLPSDAADFVMEAVPLLTNLLNYHDSKVLEYASVCLTRISEAFASSPEKLDELCNHGLVTQAAGLISITSSGGGQASLSTSTYTGLIRLLSACASGSALSTKTLHLLGISRILKDILSGSGLVASVSVSPVLTQPPEQVFEIVNLADELLPPLPQGTISLPVNLNVLVKGSAAKKSPVGTAGNSEEGSMKNEICAREELFLDQPEFLQQFGMDLLPILVQIYGSSVNGPVRHKCLCVIAKLMYFSKADMIQSLLGVTNLSSFLAAVLAWKDPQVLIPALQIAEILMEKLPAIFSKMFVREGVVHAVEMLIIPDASAAASVNSPSSEKDNDFLTGSSRSHRIRRRSVCSYPEGSSIDKSKDSLQVPGSVEVLNGKSSLRVTVSGCAKVFKEKYFSKDPESTEVGVTDDLIRLKNLCASLNANVDDVKSKSKGKSKAASGNHSFYAHVHANEHLNGIVSEMLIELSKRDGVSTFEFIGSGSVSALLNYFSCGTFSKERISDSNLPKLRQQALKRFKSFISVALPVSLQEEEAPMTILVQKLQCALSSLERFPVVLTHSSRPSGGSARLSSGLSALSQPFKLCLCRARGDKSLRDYSSNVVLIDPLATLTAVEEFLWPRVQRIESGQKSSASAENSEHGVTATESCASLSTSAPASSGRRHSTRSRSSVAMGGAGRNNLNEGRANTFKGKAKAVLKTTIDETKYPQTRNATRRCAASDKDAQKEPICSEDEELDISPIEIDDTLAIDEDDVSEDEDDVSEDEDDDYEEVLGDDLVPIYAPDKVHDVKLGDSVEDGTIASSTSNNQVQPSSVSSNRTTTVKGTDSVEFRSGSPFSSSGAMSFAAAGMAGLAPGGGRGIRGGRDRHAYLLSNSSSDPPKLIFSAGGKPLSRNLSIYQAVQPQLVFEDDNDDDNERYNGSYFQTTDSNRFWSDIYTITYRKADGQIDHASPEGSNSSPAPRTVKSPLDPNPSSAIQWQQMSLLDSILQGELLCDLEKSNSTYSILALLRVLEGLNQLAPRLRFQSVSDDFAEGRTSIIDTLITAGSKVPLDSFINSNLAPKLARQIQDALALCSGSLPSWCYQLTKACPFLFPFETRRQFFHSTAFGLTRALHRLQQQGADSHGQANDREVRVGRLKVRVSRSRILDSAAKVMEMYSSQKAVLQVEYFGEVGTGLGPTLEFYTLLSHELQKARLQMWRGSSSGGRIDTDEHTEGNSSESIKPESTANIQEMIHTALGLFPRPWSPSADSSEGTQFHKVIEYFRLLGRTMAKALQDGRLLDIPLSDAFYRLVLGQKLDLHDILSFDPELGKTLQEMQLLVVRKQYLVATDCNYQNRTSDMHFRGIPIEDLCLNFTLPGYPDYILKQGGINRVVDINSLEEYVSLVVDATVKTGITRQMEAFRAGFNQLFDITSLQIFSTDELDNLLCGRRELWKAETLVDHIKFDHGYTARSPAIVNLLEIMGEFTLEQQGAFCQFVTGAARLPLGGLAVLNPKLTIVRKHSSTANNASSNGTGVSEAADDDLPSVMTCANYLKLPQYSTKEIMHKKLLYAINEGQGSFDLS